MDAREFAAQKQELRSRLDCLSKELDRYLAGEYGVEPDTTKEFQHWQESHNPFHWCAEFFAIMRRGGFDIVIGNPPYFELKKYLKDTHSGDFASYRWKHLCRCPGAVFSTG